jgi:hypothetical protein
MNTALISGLVSRRLAFEMTRMPPVKMNRFCVWWAVQVISRLIGAWRGLLRRTRVEQDLDEELRYLFAALS